jgi:hypothetical protein
MKALLPDRALSFGPVPSRGGGAFLFPSPSFDPQKAKNFR